MSVVIGRDPELAQADQVLQRREGLHSLLIRGDAGIGKTTLWMEVMARAEASGNLTLQCRAAEAESPMPYVALGDLIAPIDTRHRQHLPGPQRRALEVALLETEAEDYPFHSRAVGAGLVTLLRELTAEGPVTIGIDDVQWIDKSSEAVLSFALRRLTDCPISLVISCRSGVPPLLEDLEEATTVVDLEPLDMAGTFHLLRNRLGRAYGRPTLVRIWETSAGNPLYALEAARAFEEIGVRPGPDEPLPLPAHRTEFISRRLAALSATAKEVLLAIALLPSPNTEQLATAMGDAARSGLEEAAALGIVSIHDGAIQFGHQLYASVLLGEAGAQARKGMHRKLAAASTDLDSKVRHLALGAEEVNDDLASQLEQAAERAERRGAPEVAAELYELACRMTPPERRASEAARRLKLGELALRSGDAERAFREVDVVLAGPLSGEWRARALDLKARLSYVAATSAEAVRACDEALMTDGLPLELRARLLAVRSMVAYDDMGRAEQDARAALDLISRLPDPDPIDHSLALIAMVGCEYNSGRSPSDEMVKKALELEKIAPNPTVSDRFSAALGAWLKYAGDLEGARHWLEHTYRSALEEGDEGSLPYAVSHLPQLELWSGNWAAAEQWALEHLELADRTGQRGQKLDALYNLAQVYAHRGQVEEANRTAREGLAEAGHDAYSEMTFGGVLGFVALSLQNHAEALTHLAAAAEAQERVGITTARGRSADYAEALIASGDLETARTVVETFEARAREAHAAAYIAVALRCKALLQASHQDLDEAASTIDEALAHHGEVMFPFDHARSLLVKGMILRRRGERRAARSVIDDSIAAFRALGARLWEDQAVAELARIPIRKKGTGRGLTEGEMRVARLVAEGLSNKEIAGELFISPKTVEANLSRIYTKLNLRSRAALATWMTASTAETLEK